MPVLNLQVGASADDADELANASGVDYVRSRLQIAANANASIRRDGGVRFTGVNIPPGAVINSATLQGYVYSVSYDDLYWEIYVEDAANAPDFTNGILANRSNLATAGPVLVGAASVGVGWYSVDVTTLIQAWSDAFPSRPNPTALVLLIRGRSDSGSKNGWIRSYDWDPNLAAKLDIDWSPGGQPTLALLGVQ